MKAELHLTVRSFAGHALVTVVGSAEFGTERILAEHLDRALDLTQTAVIVDLTECDFCDAVGLNVFATATRRARARGVSLVVCGLSGPVERIFKLSRLDQAVYPHPDLESAISWLEYGSRSPREPEHHLSR